MDTSQPPDVSETALPDHPFPQQNTSMNLPLDFNSAERWSEDISEDVARELRRRCDLQMRELPAAISDFVERRERPDQSSVNKPLSD